ncbi:MAG TPA: lytic transglycosylase domain-containing protein [Thermoleophilaceae bacterium]|nr:lytic transglycosylase domain-containing protein [Thermoleophilaceae bacterium]
MSSATHVSRRSSQARARLRRRRLVAVAVAALLCAGVAAAAGVGPIGDAVREAITLPLKHDDIIRQQAADKDLDPALIAAVINEESRFRDQTSHAGARGLMQITPETADFIARRSGGTRFVQEDLADPQINIAYGSYFLRYLIRHYDGNETLAVAAYNAGQANVDRWVRRAGGPDAFDSARHIPFPETRAYVENVAASREQYREHYADDLGL